MTIQQITSAEFESNVLNASGLVGVYFYDPSYRVSLSRMRDYETAAAALTTTGVALYCVDISIEDTLGDTYEVINFNTMRFFKNGSVVDSWAGIVDTRKLSALMEQLAA